jgi:transposase
MNMPKHNPTSPPKCYNEKKKESENLFKQIVEIYVNEQSSVRTIANQMKISKSTVSRFIRSWKKAVPVEEIRPNCRPQKVTAEIRSYLGQCVAAQERPTSKSIARSLSESKNVTVSPQTVRTHLKRLNYKSSLPRTIPLLTVKQLDRRLEWCARHHDYDWNTVWFSDETYIEINQSTIPVWHKSGQRPTISKPKFALKIMCWGAVSTRFKSKLVVVQGTMTAIRYVDILKRYLINQNSKFNESSEVFQQDNAPCHTARLSKSFFSDNGITVLDWPANSPDLNPIENIWSILKKKVERRVVNSKEALIKVIEEEWEKIDIGLIRKTIESMPRRLLQVVANGGKKCDY